MRYRDSLRFKILMSFVLIGAVLGPLLAASLLWVTHTLEERAVAAVAERRLQEVIATPEDFALRELSLAPGVRVLTSMGMSAFPIDLPALPDGTHEVKAGRRAWLVALATRPEGRYAVVEDVIALDQRERISVVAMLSGTLVAVLIALWLGLYMSRRLLAPLVNLAGWAAGVQTPALRAPDEAVSPDGVGVLENALRGYAARMQESLLREREFSANVSHELRNPLAVMQNAAELIEMDATASQTTRRAAARIVNAALHLNETITVLLVLARDPASRPEEEELSVSETVAALLRDRLQEPGGAELSLQDDAEVVLQAPRIVVEVITANLIRNAQQHAWAHRIEVQVLADRVRVCDDGVGIAADELPMIRQRGVRGCDCAGDGSGLGLALVQHLCSRFGWRLEIDSVVGGGARMEWIFHPAPAPVTTERRVGVP
ncbi:MAG: HAMP domain-containing histidine kinase [Gammaproteobacteria bacterium]|nr:HAMP domain-containing histidine kinase [Gammaproteobacteria bacterium]